jgi:hypothetical protein
MVDKKAFDQMMFDKMTTVSMSSVAHAFIAKRALCPKCSNPLVAKVTKLFGSYNLLVAAIS